MGLTPRAQRFGRPWWAGGQLRREAAGGARAPNAASPWPPRPGLNRRHDAATIPSASSSPIITPRNRNWRGCPRRPSPRASRRSRTGRCVPSSRWWPGDQAAGAGCCTRAWMVVEVAALAGHHNIVSTAKASTPPRLVPTPSSRAALRARSSRRRYSMGDPGRGQGWSLIDGRAGLHQADTLTRGATNNGTRPKASKANSPGPSDLGCWCAPRGIRTPNRQIRSLGAAGKPASSWKGSAAQESSPLR
jgi:hypothetical protein